MKTLILTLALALALISCSTDKQELLTSKSWTIDPTSLSKDEPSGQVLKFLKDGTYQLEGTNLQVNGKWSWKGEDEIDVMVEGLITDNGPAQFDKSTNYNLRILEISSESLRFLEKGEADRWDSGLAKERKYVPQK